MAEEKDSMENENYLKTLKEGLQIELKESGKKIPDSLYETYSSFSNTKGGIIYLGIKEGKTNDIIGVSNPEEQKKALISTLHSKNKASYCCISDQDVQIINLNGKKVLRFVIKEAPLEAKPVYLDGNLSKSYIRIGEGDFLMSEDEIASLLIKKKGVGFDMLPNSLDLDETNLDQESIKEFRKQMNEINPDNVFKNLNDHDFLLRAGVLIKNNGREVLKNGAVLFFGNQSDISQICPNYFLDYQENFSGKTRWDRRIVSDENNFNANLFNFFCLVRKNLIEKLPNPFRTDGISNINGKDIQRSVIEGLVNAITNCDFSSLPGIVIKKTYENITFLNSGDIPVGVKQAISGGVTNPLNKNIMNYFRLLQVSDRAGSGVPSIFEMCRSYGFLTPNLSVENDPKRTVLIINFTQLNQETPHYNEKKTILSYLVAHPEGASTEEISRMIGMKNSSTALIISELLLMNLIKTNGKKTKGKRYFATTN